MMVTPVYEDLEEPDQKGLADAGRWPPRDKSLLWRLSSEYADLFATHPIDDKRPWAGDRESWRDGAILLLWIAGALVLASAALQIIVLSFDSTGGVLTAFRVAITLLLGMAVLIAIGVGQKYASARNAFYARVRWIKAHEVEAALNALQDGLTLERLFTLNRKQLDEYHVMSVRQASTSFRNATVTSLVGFATLIAGAVISLNQQTESDSYVAAGLAGLGATLTTFISRNFFTSWRATREQLREYYVEPARTSKLLGLERLALQRVDGDGQRDIPEALRQIMVTKLLEDFAAESKAERQRRVGRARRGRPTSDTAGDDHEPADPPE